MKNNAILSAGNTKPTRGTKIAGKNAAVIFFLWNFLFVDLYYRLYTKSCYN